MSNRKKHDDDWDPGITVAEMNGDELPKYRRMAYLDRKKRPSKAEKAAEKAKYTRKERRAILRAGILALLPRLLFILLGFALAGLIVWLWLK